VPLRHRQPVLGAPRRTGHRGRLLAPRDRPGTVPAADLRLDARFVESDVYALPDALDETFDIVYTSRATRPLEAG
jgi:hypothetical protein